jgi:hypothetical protein
VEHILQQEVASTIQLLFSSIAPCQKKSESGSAERGGDNADGGCPGKREHASYHVAKREKESPPKRAAWKESTMCRADGKANQMRYQKTHKSHRPAHSHCAGDQKCCAGEHCKTDTSRVQTMRKSRIITGEKCVKRP